MKKRKVIPTSVELKRQKHEELCELTAYERPYISTMEMVVGSSGTFSDCIGQFHRVIARGDMIIPAYPVGIILAIYTKDYASIGVDTYAFVEWWAVEGLPDFMPAVINTEVPLRMLISLERFVEQE